MIDEWVSLVGQEIGSKLESISQKHLFIQRQVREYLQLHRGSHDWLQFFGILNLPKRDFPFRNYRI
jgi:hypothetical protein